MSHRFTLDPGDGVWYVDKAGTGHAALVARVEGPRKFSPPDNAPLLNLVYMDTRNAPRSPFGLTILRLQAVPHSSRVSKGHFWRMPEEMRRG